MWEARSPCKRLRYKAAGVWKERAAQPCTWKAFSRSWEHVKGASFGFVRMRLSACMHSVPSAAAHSPETGGAAIPCGQLQHSAVLCLSWGGVSWPARIAGIRQLSTSSMRAACETGAPAHTCHHTCRDLVTEQQQRDGELAAATADEDGRPAKSARTSSGAARSTARHVVRSPPAQITCCLPRQPQVSEVWPANCHCSWHGKK